MKAKNKKKKKVIQNMKDNEEKNKMREKQDSGR